MTPDVIEILSDAVKDFKDENYYLLFQDHHVDLVLDGHLTKFKVISMKGEGKFELVHPGQLSSRPGDCWSGGQILHEIRDRKRHFPIAI